MAKTSLGGNRLERRPRVGLCDESGNKADATYEGIGWICVRERLMGGKFNTVGSLQRDHRTL